MPSCIPGNTVDKSTVASVIRDLKSRFLLDRVVFVGDRGMLSVDNLETILDEELGFIVAHTLRRNAVAVDVIEKLGTGSIGHGRRNSFFAMNGHRCVLFWRTLPRLHSRPVRNERHFCPKPTSS